MFISIYIEKIFIFIYTYMYIYIHAHTYTHIYIYMCIYMYRLGSDDSLPYKRNMSFKKWPLYTAVAFVQRSSRKPQVKVIRLQRLGARPMVSFSGSERANAALLYRFSLYNKNISIQHNNAFRELLR